MNLRALLLSALLLAGPAHARSLPDDHNKLLNTLHENGVQVWVNHPNQICGDNTIDGAYIVFKDTQNLVVCQDNYDLGNDYTVVSWTDNDLDTIRHEAFHVIQDCMVGETDDYTLDTVFVSTQEVVVHLGIEEAQRIYTTYAMRGANEQVIRLELEAFYAARFMSASEIEQTYNKYCVK